MENLNFYKGKRVFVTGHTGFKGGWLCSALIAAGAEVAGYSLLAPTQPNLFSLVNLEEKMNSVIGDVRDYSALKDAFDAAAPEIVFHLAAQPIVRAGYEQPVYTYETNVMGTVNVLECIRTAQSSVKSALIVTTDKVYDNKERTEGYREDESLDGFDPYSNSKSCAELATHCYVRSFFAKDRLPVSTMRAGNVIGGGDFARDRIIPDCIRAAQQGNPIIVRNPNSVRPYQHVLEPVAAYLMVAQRQCDQPEFASSFNIGPDDCDCVTTGELADMFCRAWGDGLKWENRAEKNAPHEAGLLTLNCDKLKRTFAWEPKWHVDEAIAKTVEWTKAWLNQEDLGRVMECQINEYMEK